MMKNITLKKQGLISFVIAGLLSFSVQADDIEIFGNIDQVPANVLFVLDTSSSMNQTAPGSSDSKLKVLKDTMETVLDEEYSSLNMGVMDFSNWTASGVDLPVKPVNKLLSTGDYLYADSVFNGYTWTADATHQKNKPAFPHTPWKEWLNQKVQNYGTGSKTPMQGAQYEAGLYFAGEGPNFGDNWDPFNWPSAHISTYEPKDAWKYVMKHHNGHEAHCWREWTHNPGRPNHPPFNFPHSSPDKWENCSGKPIESCTRVYHVSASNGYTLYKQCCYGGYDATGTECLAYGRDPSCGVQEYHHNSYPQYWEQTCTYNTPGYDSPGWNRGAATYISPIEDQCQKNYVVLMTDGVPTPPNYGSTYKYSSTTDEIAQHLYHKNIIDLIEKKTGACQSNMSAFKDDDGDDWFINDSGSPLDISPVADGKCAVEMAEYLHTTDQCRDDNGHCSIAGEDSRDQTVETYTIGFDLAALPAAKKFLELVAHKGGGSFYSADNASDLVTAFKNVLTDISGRNSTFTSPSVSAKNWPFSHDLDAYFPMFQSGLNPPWDGNVKKYKISNGEFLDEHDNPVFDADGKFNTDIEDLWNADSSYDKDKVNRGGTRSNLTTARPSHLWVDNSGQTALQAFSLSNVNDADFNLYGSESYSLEDLVKFTQGINADGTARKFVGDPLHSLLVPVNYPGGKQVLFYNTNEGYLHAIDIADGKEQWAYIPRELLKNQKDFKEGKLPDVTDFTPYWESVRNYWIPWYHTHYPSLDIETLFENYERSQGWRKPAEHAYGLDGKMQIFHQDSNENGIIESNETAYLAVGMRRGGNDYYVLDISNPGQPAWAFSIKGGQGDFSELAQTWSPPTFAKIKTDTNGSEEFVMIFAGGYDDKQDFDDASYGDDTDGAFHDGVTETDDKGRAIYVVGLEGSHQGQVLLKFDNSDGIQNSIPAGVAAVDSDDDGLADRLYTADVGGNIWSVALAPNLGSSVLHKVASLNDGASASGNRRFYYRPSVSQFTRNGKSYYAVAIGSGFRAHPLNKTIEDRFYVVFDDGDATASAITESDLYDATDNTIGSDSNKTAQTEIFDANKDGWFVKLGDDGEKVLAGALTVDYKVLFTSFSPTEDAGNVSDVCTPRSIGSAYFYALDLLDAEPSFEFVDDDKGNKANRRTTLKLDGIPGEPVVVRLPGGDQILAGRSVVKDRNGESPLKQDHYRQEYWINYAD